MSDPKRLSELAQLPDLDRSVLRSASGDEPSPRARRMAQIALGLSVAATTSVAASSAAAGAAAGGAGTGGVGGVGVAASGATGVGLASGAGSALGGAAATSVAKGTIAVTFWKIGAVVGVAAAVAVPTVAIVTQSTPTKAHATDPAAASLALPRPASASTLVFDTRPLLPKIEDEPSPVVSEHVAPAVVVSADSRAAFRPKLPASRPEAASGARLGAPASGGTCGLEPQISMLERAHAALAAGRPSEALALSRRYLASHRDGDLAPEAELIAFDAERAMGHHESAIRIGERYLARYGSAPAAVRVRRAVDELRVESRRVVP